jgi:hypothetical protein
MIDLKQTPNEQVVVKLAGLTKALSCTVVSLEEAGVWLEGQELKEGIRNDFQQVLLPAGYAKIFVPFARLDFLVHSTEER